MDENDASVNEGVDAKEGEQYDPLFREETTCSSYKNMIAFYLVKRVDDIDFVPSNGGSTFDGLVICEPHMSVTL